MIERRYGRIINIASLSSFVSLMEVAAYSASKSAVASLNQVAGNRVGAIWRLRKRNCAWSFSDAA